MTLKKGLQFVGATALSVLLLTACGNKDAKNKVKSNAPTTTATSEKGASLNNRLAYVNIDTLNKHYVYLKSKRDIIEKKRNAFESEISTKEKALQNEMIAFQKKIQAGNVSQAEGEATEKRLGQQQQALQQRAQSGAAQLEKELAAIQEEFDKKLDDFLADLNKDNKYDFIFGYSKLARNMLYVNTALDITDQVLADLNAKENNSNTTSNTATSDTTKK